MSLVRDLQLAWNLFRRRPFDCLIQVTNRCNMNCRFCGFWSNPVSPDDELTLDDFRRLEEDLFGLGRFMVSIEGGEPFLRPDLAEIVRVFSRRHVTLLYTNGWFVDRESARALFDAGLTQVGVSIDFADALDHDRERGLEGTFRRAWSAVEVLRDAAPRGGKQVHVITVLMRENRDSIEPLLEMTARARVGHCLTLLSKKGFRRGQWTGRPEPVSPPVSDWLRILWSRYSHMRVFRSYIDLMDAYLMGGSLPVCRAGVQSLNVDHVGNVSPCIEKIDEVAGNLREESLRDIHARLADLDWVGKCNDCWTLCRACVQLMGSGGNLRCWWDLATRMRS